MSILEEACGCTLLHEGGEADIYRVSTGGRFYVLKWYRNGASFDSLVVDKLCSRKVPGVYRIVETGRKAGRDYLMYDYIDGISLAEMNSAPVPVAISLVRKLTKTLAELDGYGIHHGDLNPANVIVDSECTPTLIDCGIVGPGALAFAAPERIQGKKANVQSDIYSLGLLLYRLVAGKNLIESDSYDGFTRAAAGIDSVNTTALLYGMGVAADELSALAPVWKSSLRSEPSQRAEDMDEFDEILEIAFRSLSGGAVTWMSMQNAFGVSLNEKIGTKRNEVYPEIPLPQEFKVIKATVPRKNIVFVASVVLILVVLVLFFALSSRNPSIDETGAAILHRSRSIDGTVGISRDSLGDSARVSGEVLEKQPVPERNNEME